MFQASFDTLKGVENEFRVVVELLDERRRDPLCVCQVKACIELARAQSEKTYLLRLLAEFEGILLRLGPRLYNPVEFSYRDSLGFKLDQIGNRMRMEERFRKVIDDRIREHRNELSHGRSPVPRVSFQYTLSLMKEFLRKCR